jgi:hypothetical protein
MAARRSGKSLGETTRTVEDYREKPPNIRQEP